MKYLQNKHHGTTMVCGHTGMADYSIHVSGIKYQVSKLDFNNNNNNNNKDIYIFWRVTKVFWMTAKILLVF